VNDRHRLSMNFLKVFDIAAAVLAFGLSTALIVQREHRLSLVQFLSVKTTISNFAIFGLTMVVCHLLFCACGLYRRIKLSSGWAELGEVLRATTLCVVCLAFLGAAFSNHMMTLPFLTLFWALTGSALCLSRPLLRLVLGYVRLHHKTCHLLILGTNFRAVEFARRALADPDRAYRLIGFVDDEWPGAAEFKKTGFPLVSNYAGLAEFLRGNVIDEVANYLPFGAFFNHYRDVAGLCEQHGIIMRFNADIFTLKTARWRAEVFHGNHYIATYTGTSEGPHQTIKRALDIAIASGLLLLLLPALVCVAIAIKLSSPGPIFFMQERIGLNKRRFKIFKFRTMVPNAEKLLVSLEELNEVAGPVFKMKNDPRVTPIGRFLRRSSIDELPQLLNVLKGDMSLVGPRPMAVRDFQGFNEDWQRRRFSMKPGMTCLWQVNGRSSVPFEQWMLLDLQYMDEWSLWLDLKILFKTVPAVLKGAGAA
jgi:exopolysaccharide biosynthesis polyprenyl glycosylphosphotransferase